MPAKKHALFRIGGYVVLFTFVCGAYGFRQQPSWVEKYYSTGLYPFIFNSVLSSFRNIKWSVGDRLYCLIGLIGLYFLFVFLKHFPKSKRLLYITHGVKKLVVIAAIGYLVFNCLWGFNYNRLGIRHQLQLKPVLEDTNQLSKLCTQFVWALNSLKKDSSLSDAAPSITALNAVCASAYRQNRFGFLHSMPSVAIKSSMYASLLDYVGITGYYNFLTGEAHVNTHTPPMALPFVACHEMAHQLGYAAENEANFVSYLVCVQSQYQSLQYAAYFELFPYLNANLYRTHPAEAKRNVALLNPAVKKDYKTWYAYYKKSNTVMERFNSFFYDQFLKANAQKSGIQSYSEVVALVLSYHQQYGVGR